MSEELKPCPFCGGSVECQTREDAVFVVCITCPAEIHVERDELNDGVDAIDYAEEAWNRRADDAERDRLRKLLSGILSEPCVQDLHYQIRECEVKGWEGPRMVAWGKLMSEAKAELKEKR